ncbi:LacI family DNA-binding transcriptional regulator [Microbacterium halophytorum]|uniref:LacI family DNA-binding transcriptional regulator n=1 Tax=Microbacterium halophytorum TaxID=2067568 RepID=UPI000CFB67A3|nr:LacI family DNA-binding transcriptional regulator [Microbacterium halophytorum]
MADPTSGSAPAEMSIRELARICGVAVSTVSRAMNDRSDVNPATRDRIRAEAAKHGYVPNASARRLKISTTTSISVIIQGELGQLLIEVLEHLERRFADAGYETTLTHIADRQASAETVQRIVRAGKFGGVVFLGRYGSADREASAQLSRRLAEIQVPMVFCTTPDYSGADALHSSVSVDDRTGVYELANHLIARGHRRIAFVGAGDQHDREHAWALRLAGYRAALTDAGIDPDPRLVLPSRVPGQLYSMANGHASVANWLGEHPDDRGFTALMAVSDAAAVGAARALNEAGVRVPDECSLVGFDGLDIANYYVPRITTLAQPIAEIAESTARVLLDTVKSPRRAIEQVWIRGRLAEGESVREV